MKPCPYEIETDDKGEKKLLINSTRFKLKMTLSSESIISRLGIAENLISDLQDNTEKKLRNPEEKAKGLYWQKMRKKANQSEIQFLRQQFSKRKQNRNNNQRGIIEKCPVFKNIFEIERVVMFQVN